MWPAHYCRLMIGHGLGRIGICMEEHTCEARLPHINGNVVRKREMSGAKGLVPCSGCPRGKAATAAVRRASVRRAMACTAGSRRRAKDVLPLYRTCTQTSQAQIIINIMAMCFVGHPKQETDCRCTVPYLQMQYGVNFFIRDSTRTRL